MNLIEAMEVALDLATQNALDEDDCDRELAAEARRQAKALEKVQDLLDKLKAGKGGKIAYVEEDLPEPVDAVVAGLVHAYAKGAANGGEVAWEDLNQLWDQARGVLGPERVAQIEAMYQEEEDA